MQVPFTLDSNGSVAIVTDPDVQAYQHIRSLVGTNPGERVMRPDYGVPIRKYLFAPDPAAVSAEISLEVRTQMAKWEPSLTVLDVIPTSTGEFGVSDVQVDATRNLNSESETMTAIVNVGGTVVSTPS